MVGYFETSIGPDAYSPDMNTGPVQTCAVAMAVPGTDFGENLPFIMTIYVILDPKILFKACGYFYLLLLLS